MAAPRLERCVETPATINEARALGSLHVETRTERPGPCYDYSGGCVFVLPFLFAKELFPDRHLEASLTGPDGKVLYRGRFRESGELLDSIDVRSGRARFFKTLELPALGRRLVAEVAGSAVAAGGRPDDPQPISLGRQCALVDAYRRELSRRGDPQARDRLAREAVQLLGAEATPLFEGGQAPKDADNALYILLVDTCVHGNKRDERQAVLRAVGRAPTQLLASTAAVQCFGGHADDAALARPFARRQLQTLCDPATPEDALERLTDELRRFPGARDEFAASKPACASDRELLVSHALGFEVSPSAFAAALGATHGGLWVRYLRPESPAQRAGVMAALPSAPLDVLAQAISALSDAAAPQPSLPEVVAVANAYGRGGDSRHAFRASALALFRRADPKARLAARRILGRPAAAERASFAIAQVALGDTHAVEAACAGLQKITVPAAWFTVHSEPELVAFGLYSLGCSTAEIELARQTPRAAKLCVPR